MTRELTVTDNLDEFLAVLPPPASAALAGDTRLDDLLEVVLDLGRPIEARFPTEMVMIGGEATVADLEHVIARVGHFDRDNRAGIQRTLHRISCIRNRFGEVVGLTCRVGRAVYGTVDVIRDIVETGRSILLLGKPGVGKTTKLREAARVLADEMGKRVVVVDTNNEIAGGGDIPHPAIGRARRMQLPEEREQSDVMIEAVENHMPEAIIIDEISNEQDAFAARTIAERGVQLIATAHGRCLENLMFNPTLADLVGGIQAVTLSDEEARRRRTQKTVLERKAAPTFDTEIEIEAVDLLVVHHDVAWSVDELLLGRPVMVEVRERQPEGAVRRSQRPVELVGSAWRPAARSAGGAVAVAEGRREEDREAGGAEVLPGIRRVYAYGPPRRKVDKALRELRASAVTVEDPKDADIALTMAGYWDHRGMPQRPGVQVISVRGNTYGQIYEALRAVFAPADSTGRERFALQEAEQAVAYVTREGEAVELAPQNAYIRRLQHELIARHSLQSESVGKEPRRRIRVTPM
jgi:stage III sporulation protein SpoIIIAA